MNHDVYMKFETLKTAWSLGAKPNTFCAMLTSDSSYSRLLAYECSRILFRLGCDVRVFDPAGLPQKDDVQHDHHKVQELRELSKWSDGHVWVSPEQHGNLVSHCQEKDQQPVKTLTRAF